MIASLPALLFWDLELDEFSTLVGRLIAVEYMFFSEETGNPSASSFLVLRKRPPEPLGLLIAC